MYTLRARYWTKLFKIMKENFELKMSNFQKRSNCASPELVKLLISYEKVPETGLQNCFRKKCSRLSWYLWWVTKANTFVFCQKGSCKTEVTAPKKNYFLCPLLIGNQAQNRKQFWGQLIASFFCEVFLWNFAEIREKFQFSSFSTEPMVRRSRLWTVPKNMWSW